MRKMVAHTHGRGNTDGSFCNPVGIFKRKASSADDFGIHLS
jgi:hypothetical protein